MDIYSQWCDIPLHHLRTLSWLDDTQSLGLGSLNYDVCLGKEVDSMAEKAKKKKKKNEIISTIVMIKISEKA